MTAAKLAPQFLVEETSWDYRTANTKQITHGIHPYPAMLIPQVTRRLIDTYKHEDMLLFDPYCGSGTTLLEGMLAGISAVGTDLNPLARLIARVKTRPISIRALDSEIARFLSAAPDADAPIPHIPNVDYWFSAKTQRDLAAIRQHINGINSGAAADVFRVAFSLTARKASWTQNSEFKLVRMPPHKLEKHNPDSYSLMAQALDNIRQALQALSSAVTSKKNLPAVHDFNTVDGIPVRAIAPGSVDLVVTSPPYGDSRTTVAYGQFSRLSSQWLGYADASRVDNTLMGGGRAQRVTKFGFKKLDGVIADIAAQDPRRACEVVAFFEDYRASISNIALAIKPKGYACYVVGNRTVKGCTVPTAEATAAFFKENGFEIVDIQTRNIPNKRMPSANSPSNVAGKIGKTMTAEYIVTCRKAG